MRRRGCYRAGQRVPPVFGCCLCLLWLCLSHPGARGQGSDTGNDFGRLTGKRAVAVFDDSTPGQLNGLVEFSLCDTDGVFVQVNLEDSVTGFSCLDDPILEACLYQINSGSVDPAALADPSIGLGACGDAFDIFDPTMSGGLGWPPPDEDDDDGDICSSTKSATFGQGGKLESCPVGGLSRKWGVLDPFFDQNLAIFNNIIGRSLLVYSLGSDELPDVISCAPIVFESNCHDTEKDALLAFKDSLDAGAELLYSWEPDRDMCDEFLGIRCDPQGHVVQLLLDDSQLSDVRANLIAPRVSAVSVLNSSAPGVLRTPQPATRNAAHSSLKLSGPLPHDFGTLEFLKVMRIPGHELYGSLPTRWNRLSALRELNITNNLVDGRLPKSYAGMRELEKLDLSSNALTGTLPEEWSELTQLQRVNASVNALTGTVPIEWSALTRIINLDLSENAGLCDPGGLVNSLSNRTVDMDACGTPAPPILNEEPVEIEEPETSVIILVSVLVPVVLLCITLIGALVWGFKYHRRTHARGLGGSTSRMVDSGVPKVTPVDVGSTSSPSKEEAESLNGSKEQQDIKIEMCGMDDTAATEPVSSYKGDNTQSPFVDLEIKHSASPPRSAPRTGGSQPGDGHRASAAVALRLSGDSTNNSASGSGSISGLSHCPSGMHPLDFSGVHDVPGATVDRCHLLGGGGYGVVYRGTLTRGGKVLDVAVKVISNSDQDELHSSKYKSFVDEVETLSLVQGNDCIVTMYDYILEYPRAVIFYEYLENDTLGRLIHKLPNKKRLNYLEVLQMGYGISEGLVGLHSKGIIHRDLKPDNILLDSHMRPRLTDFGISRKMNPDASSITTQNIGTWIYMAPEQFNGRLSEASDVYSLGMILWECWCSKRPWGNSGDDMEIWQVMYRLIHENERPEIPGNCPTSLAAVINDCWHTDAKERPTALDVKNRLWRIILAEMKKLNGGPQRVPSPKRIAKQEAKADELTEKPGSPLRPKDDAEVDGPPPALGTQALNCASRLGEASAKFAGEEKRQ